MNKVITINLGGTAYQLEESGYDALRAYLESAAQRLQSNPDRAEILSDIEQAVAEKFRAHLSPFKTVIVTNEVTAALAEMGPIEGDAETPAGAIPMSSAGSSGAAGSTNAGSAATGAGAVPGVGPAKRLYRIMDGAMICGVANGLAAYFNVDPTIVRIVLVLLGFFWGFGFLAYILMVLVVPKALSPEERAAAYGVPSTTQEFIRRAKQGYYDAMKALPDRQARRAWKREMKAGVRSWSQQVKNDARFGRWRWAGPRGWWGAQGVAAHPGMGAGLPLFSVLRGALLVAFLCGLVSLLSTGTAFGVPLPAGVPVWAGIVILFMMYRLVAWPMHAARRVIYYSTAGATGAGWPAIYFVDVLISVACVIVLLRLGSRHLGDVQSALHQAPVVFRQGADDIRDWWNQH